MANQAEQAKSRSFFGRLKFRFLSFFRNDFFSYRHTKRPLAIALFVNIIQWAAIIFKTRLEVRPIPLHFTASYGIELVGPAFWLLELPVVGLMLLGLNGYLGKQLYKERPYLAVLLNYISLLLQVSLLIAASVILIFNF